MYNFVRQYIKTKLKNAKQTLNANFDFQVLLPIGGFSGYASQYNLLVFIQHPHQPYTRLK